MSKLCVMPPQYNHLYVFFKCPISPSNSCAKLSLLWFCIFLLGAVVVLAVVVVGVVLAVVVVGAGHNFLVVPAWKT